MKNLAKSVLLVISMSSTAMAQLVPGPRPAPYPGGGGGTVAPAPGSGGYLVPGPRPPMPPPPPPGWGGGHHDHDDDDHHGGGGWVQPRPPMPPPPPPGWGPRPPMPPPPPMYPPRPPMPPPPTPYPSPYPSNPYPSPYPGNPYPAPNPGYRQTINLNVYRSVFGNDRIDLTQYVNLWQYRGYRIEQVIVQGSTRWNSAVVSLMINGFNYGSLQFMSQYSQQQSLWLNQMPMIGNGADSLVLYTSGDMTVENVILVIR